MIIDAKKLKEFCSKVLVATSANALSDYNGKLELKSENGCLYMNVTNNEYYVSLNLGSCAETFHATIVADLFLKLISQVTSQTVELSSDDVSLNVVANGKYKFPIIYEGQNILNLPKIEIKNVAAEFDINSDILNSILLYNSKELSKISETNKLAVNILQRMYYLDDEGAITFYSGACVNKFTLDKPVKLLLGENLVRLFGLFKDCTVNFKMGHDPKAILKTDGTIGYSDTIVQTKVMFKTDDTEIIAVLGCDDSMVQKMPAKDIRDRAFNQYPYVITIDRQEFLSCMKRLILFTKEVAKSYKTSGHFVFDETHMVISDKAGINTEEIQYTNAIPTPFTYEADLDLIDLKLAMENNKDQCVTLSFGNHQAMVLAKDNIYTVIPEIM